MISSMIILILAIGVLSNDRIKGPNLPKGTTCKKVNPTDVHPTFQANQVIFSGYLNVEDGLDACLAYIFYGSQKANLETLFTFPTILWLSGGPGVSSQTSNYMEMGPIIYNIEGEQIYNENSWTKEYNMLFIDQPITTGLSYGPKESIPTDMDQIAEHLYYALMQFLTANQGCIQTHAVKHVPQSKWFVFGESYGGKFVPAIGEFILNQNKKSEYKINLKGIGMGDPFTDPIAVVSEYGSFGYSLGFVDMQERAQVDSLALSSIKAMRQGDLIKSNMYFNEAKDVVVRSGAIRNVYNIFYYDAYERYGPFIDFFNNAEELRKFGFAEDWVYDYHEAKVREALLSDFMRIDCVKRVENILEEIPVLVYQGQNDFIVPNSATSRWVYNLKHKNAAAFQNSDFEVWKLNDKVVGYQKTKGNLQYSMVLNAGHEVPAEQPEVAYDLVKAFIGRYI